jgi:hypothetical protein
MSTPTLQPSAQASSLLRIDEELIAVAIHEIRAAHIAPATAAGVAEDSFSRRCSSFILLILLELMLPGVKADAVLTLLQQLVVSPAIKHLHKIGDES